MAVLIPGPASLELDRLNVFLAKDSLIGNLPVVVFYGASTTTNSTQNTSRVQVHVFSVAGFVSFPRLTLAPTSPLYAAVPLLPVDRQGDEVCRGLAIGLYKYFLDLPGPVKSCLVELVAASHKDGLAPPMFDERHAARLAAKMARVENSAEISHHINSALSEKSLSWSVLDVILPDGSMPHDPDSPQQDPSVANHQTSAFVERFASLLDVLGSPSFLPSSKIRRAPSKPSRRGLSPTIDDQQLEGIRQDVVELFETECSYVEKLRELTSSLAVEHARAQGSTHTIQYTKFLQQLFPTCLETILSLHLTFADALSRLVSTYVGQEPRQEAAAPKGSIKCIAESTGNELEQIADLFIDFLHDARAPYTEYLAQSTHFASALNALLEDDSSFFVHAVRQTGEQRLRSWCIEPVQRLPRYALLFDNICRKLPTRHTAIKPFLKARDLVRDICSLDDDIASTTRSTNNRLRAWTHKWPSELAPSGRLITIVDAFEQRAPFDPTSTRDSAACILLLFADYLIVLQQQSGFSMNARSLQTDLAQLPTISESMISSSEAKSLTLTFAFRLSDLRILESKGGKLFSVVRQGLAARQSESNGGTRLTSLVRTYLLAGAYEGKASRLSEEICRASLETRYDSAVRDSDNWALRALTASDASLSLLCAVCEAGEYSRDVTPWSDALKTTPISMEVFTEGAVTKGSSRLQPDPAAMSLQLTLQPGDRCQLRCRGPHDFSSEDQLTNADLPKLLCSRIGHMQRLAFRPLTPEMAQLHIAWNRKVAESIRAQLAVVEAARSRFRPVSPVKVLSSFFSPSFKETSTATEEIGSPLGNASPSPIPIEPLARAMPSLSKQISLVGATESTMSSMAHLEAVLQTYIIALFSRAGNIVGRTLRTRDQADPHQVQAMHEKLLKDSKEHQAAAEASVDVLFAAFERFLQEAWRERIGAIVTRPLLHRLQDTFDTCSRPEIAPTIRNLLADVAPQNQRAFGWIMHLLGALLDAAGNDGDRGALMVTFTEALVTEQQPEAYMLLFDRLVDDLDLFFEDAGPLAGKVSARMPLHSAESSIGNPTAASVSSTGSSLRKRFGLGVLTRENSRTDGSDSKVGSIIRSLSKRNGGDVDGGTPSISRSLLSRSRSVESIAGRAAHSRPVSRDRPISVYSAADSRPGTGRSAADSTPSSLASEPKKEGILASNPARQALHPSSPAKLQRPPPPETPTKVSTLHKENAPLGSTLPPLHITPINLDFDSIKTDSVKTVAAKAPKWKMASPQKLRERLHKEQQALQDVGPTLQAELTQIGDELQALRIGKVSRTNSQANKTESTDVGRRLTILEERITATLNDHSERGRSLESAIAVSIAGSETKAKKLDTLYREANAENELLYERFNGELMRILQAVQIGQGSSELRSQLGQAQAEAAQLRKENQRLKREVVGLRAAMRPV